MCEKFPVYLGAFRRRAHRDFRRASHAPVRALRAGINVPMWDFKCLIVWKKCPKMYVSREQLL